MKYIKLFLIAFVFIATQFILYPTAKAVASGLPYDGSLYITATPSVSTVSKGQIFNATIKIKNPTATNLNISVDLDFGYALPAGSQQYYLWCDQNIAASYNQGCDGTDGLYNNLSLPASQTITIVAQGLEISPTRTPSIGSNQGPLQIAVYNNTTPGPMMQELNPFTVKIAAAATATVTPTTKITATKATTTVTPTTSTSITPTTGGSTVTPTTTAAGKDDDAFNSEFTQEGSETSTKESFLKDGSIGKEDLVLDNKGKNKIRFLNQIDLSGKNYNKLINENVFLTKTGYVEIKSQNAEFLNVQAEITMSGLKFTETPDILHNGKFDDSVSNVSYDKTAGVLKFTVKGFSSYEAVEHSRQIVQVNNNSTIFYAILAIILALVTGGTAFVCYQYRDQLKAKLFKK